MSLHNFVRVISVLNGVPRLAFGKNCIGGHTLGPRKLLHHLGLDKLVLHCASGHQQTRCNSGVVLPDRFQYARSGDRSDGAIVFRRIAQHQNHIELALLGVAHGNGKVEDGDAGNRGRQHNA